jgi:hypothetical protein
MIRDIGTMALVETDIDKRNKYRIEKMNLREMAVLKRDIVELKESINRINTIIDKLVKE